MTGPDALRSMGHSSMGHNTAMKSLALRSASKLTSSTSSRLAPALVLAVLLVAPVEVAGQSQGTPPAESPEISPTESPAPATENDREIERHLEATFSQLEDLQGVGVSVTSGVVRLEGEVLSAEARELAEKLANETSGTVVVDNRIDEIRDLDRRVGPTLEKLRERGLDFVALLPLLGVAVIVVLLFYFLARWIGRWKLSFLQRTGSHFLDELVRQVLRLAVILVGIVLALDLLNATALVGAVLGTAGVVGLALGFAFRDTAENYIASVLLSVRQPFAPNDTVKIEGYEGKVVRLTSRATILLTFDGNQVRIPNAMVFKGIVVNYTQQPQRRFDFTVGVGTEEDLGEAIRLGLSTLLETPGVLEEPPPQVLVEALGDSAVVVHGYAWVDQMEASLLKVKSEAIRRVKEAFDGAGIAMPEPIYQVKGLVEEPRPSEVPRAKPAAESPGPETSKVTDIAPETHIDRQVEADRATAGETDLLDPAAQRE